MDERMKQIAPQDAAINDGFWNRYLDLVADIVVPYQWDLINDRVPDAERSGCIHNFKVAAGLEEGAFIGMPFQDSDLAKWIEAAAFSLIWKPDADLEKRIDEAAELIAKAQDQDGYYDTYFLINEPDKKWLNLKEGHELYVAGHFIEAAVTYYEVTGKENLLSIVKKNAELIGRVFGKGEGQIRGYPGHPEIELALVRLYEVTGEEKYLELADYFVMERGQEPYIIDELHEKYGHDIFPGIADQKRDYMQSHLPVLEQKTAEGHAVRALYLYTAMADLAALKNDERLLKACETLYRNIVGRRMYITGAVGSAGHEERFTCDYDLPNDMAYAESCASVALAMFCQRMVRKTLDGRYADTMEQALYNTVLAGISLTGKEFFYVNPLEVIPEVCEKNTDHFFVKPVRQKWFACACCPPNIARTIAGISRYAMLTGKTEDGSNCVSFLLFIGGEWNARFDDGLLKLKVTTEYPRKGEVVWDVEEASLNEECQIMIRIPGWSRSFEAELNGEKIETIREKSFISLKRKWRKGDQIRLVLDLHPRFMKADPRVAADAGRCALMMGPLVYSLEEADNGKYLSTLSVDPGQGIEVVKAEYFCGLPGYTNILKVKGFRDVLQEDEDDCLYYEWENHQEALEITAVPYFLWGNRGKGEMLVWMRTI